MNLIILGAPGSGKGTQAELLAKKYNLTHISTGQMFRNEISSGSEFGEEIKRYIDNGELVPDDILFSILEKTPLKEGNGFILDGTPRNMEQAKVLKETFDRIEVKVDAVIFLQVPRDVSFKRLLDRAQKEHRSDDTAKVIEERLDIYEKDTKEITDFYRQQGILVSIDGIPGIDTIFKNICIKLDALK